MRDVEITTPANTEEIEGMYNGRLPSSQVENLRILEMTY